MLLDQENQWICENGSEPLAKECSYSKIQQTITSIFIPSHVEAVINKLKKEIKSEWQMFLTGQLLDNQVIIDGYVIPKQEVTNDFVKNLECIDKEYIQNNRIVAGIHSHSDMGVFFSSTDDETNNTNIDFHIVTNNKGEYLANQKIKLPCGYKKMIPIDINFADFTVNGIDNIQKKKLINTYSNINNKILPYYYEQGSFEKDEFDKELQYEFDKSVYKEYTNDEVEEYNDFKNTYSQPFFKNKKRKINKK